MLVIANDIFPINDEAVQLGLAHYRGDRRAVLPSFARSLAVLIQLFGQTLDADFVLLARRSLQSAQPYLNLIIGQPLRCPNVDRIVLPLLGFRVGAAKGFGGVARCMVLADKLLPLRV